MKNADESELKAIASPPEDTHVYNVEDFDVMNSIVNGLTKTICERVETLHKQLRGVTSHAWSYECNYNLTSDWCWCERSIALFSPAGGGAPAAPPPFISPPRDLVTSEVTARSFRVSWTHAPSQVEKYRVVYYPASGGRPDEKVLPLLNLI